MARRKSSDATLILLAAVVGGVIWVGQAVMRFLHAFGPILLGIFIIIGIVWGIKRLTGKREQTENSAKNRDPANTQRSKPQPNQDKTCREPVELSAQEKHNLSAKSTNGQSPVAGGFSLSSQPISTAPSARVVTQEPTSAKPMRRDPESKPISTGWVSPGKPVTLHNCVVLDGMVYVGSYKQHPDASTIDQSLTVRFNKNLDYTQSQLGYWPSYREATAEARGAYLQWLADGKKSTAADIGFVFLYFYGLERRVLVDSVNNPQAASEIPAIETEITRLLTIYSQNGSFRGYAGSLLNYLQARQSNTQAIPESLPNLAKSFEIPFAVKLGLSAFVAQEAQIPGEWAYAWWFYHPETRPRTVAERCPQEFKQLFLEYYRQQYQAGLRIRPNKTKLVAIHRVASPTFPSRQYQYALDVPDVTVLSAPFKKLQAVAEYCYQALDRYSRHLGRKPENAGKIDALLELPTLLWPEPMKQPLLKIHGMVSQSGLMLAAKFEKVLSLLPPWEVINKTSYAAFARSINQIGLGIEPDPLYGGSVPVAKQTVVLFIGGSQELMAEPSQRYKTAALSLHFAAAVSQADGEFSLAEREAMVRQLQGWLHLDEGERNRLQAYLRWLAAEPPALSGLKKRVEDMPVSSREALGDFLVLVAKSDDQVSPSEVKVLEKVFKMLGLEAATLYGKLHAHATEPVTIKPSTEPTNGFAIPAPPSNGVGLDMVKVSCLQQDTQKVAELLHGIFGEEEPVLPTAGTQAVDNATNRPVGATGLLGLSGELSEFVRLLLTRPEWTRGELEELASDRSLLLDGCLEHINEAAFDRFDQALVEGEDPLEINQELIGEIAA